MAASTGRSHRVFFGGGSKEESQMGGIGDRNTQPATIVGDRLSTRQGTQGTQGTRTGALARVRAKILVDAYVRLVVVDDAVYTLSFLRE